MLFRNLAAALLCAALSIALPANAGMPPMSDDQLAASAELIVRGCVESVVKHDQVSYPDDKDERSAVDLMIGFFRPRPKLVTANYTVTMEVDQIEIGELPPGEHRIQFTGWQNVKTPPHWMGGSNTLRLPLQSGDEIKVYLERHDNQWVLFHHMGIWMRR